MSGWLTVFKKEVKENFRDRRVIFTSLVIGPLFGPLLLIGMFSLMADKTSERMEEALELPVVGQQYAPNLINYLIQEGVEIKPAPNNPEAAVKAKDEDVVLRIPADFSERWDAGQRAIVEVIVDESRNHVGVTSQRLRRLLNAYSSQIGILRLQLRGVSPQILNPIMVKTIDQSTPTSRAARLLSFLPYILMIGAFVGGMHLAIDATAGEKERHSLEPLLINPVPRWQIMAGKLMATSFFAGLSVFLTVIAFRLLVPFLPADLLGTSISITNPMLLGILVVILPMAILASAFLTILASFAKSFREANSYMGLVTLIPMLPSFYLMINPVKAETWMMAVPLLSQNVLIHELIRGEQVSISWYLIAGGTTLGLGLVLAAIAATLYNRPRVIFSGE
ncbi:MAG: ABC transporter permease [Proteobacteria bacterium]|nr:ABC transporter permease [Pseudomonadota bacterium]